MKLKNPLNRGNASKSGCTGRKGGRREGWIGKGRATRRKRKEESREEGGRNSEGKNSAHRENSFKDERPANDLFSIRKS